MVMEYSLLDTCCACCGSSLDDDDELELDVLDVVDLDVVVLAVWYRYEDMTVYHMESNANKVTPNMVSSTNASCWSCAGSGTECLLMARSFWPS